MLLGSRTAPPWHHRRQYRLQPCHLQSAAPGRVLWLYHLSSFRCHHRSPTRPHSRAPAPASGAPEALVLTLPMAQREASERMPPNVRTQAKTAAASSNNYLAGSSSSSAVVVMPPQQMTPDAAFGCGDGVGYAAAGVSCASSAPMASLGAPQAGLMTGVGAAASLAHLSFMPGRASRCCFGDTEHHVDAPRSPIKGHVPLQTTGTRAGQPCAYGHWGAAPPHDPNRLFGASPVNRLQPATLHAAELLAPGMVPPPTLPQTPLDPSSPIARRGTVAPRGVELPFVAEGRLKSSPSWPRTDDSAASCGASLCEVSVASRRPSTRQSSPRGSTRRCRGRGPKRRWPSVRSPIRRPNPSGAPTRKLRYAANSPRCSSNSSNQGRRGHRINQPERVG